MLNLQLDKPLIQHVDEACNKFADRTCFIFGDKKTTYQEIQEASCRIANQLIAAGFEKDMALSETEIIEFCKKELGSVKAPKSVNFADTFPKNSNGKVLKRKMRERVKGELN